jgi:hypothetical protein
MGAKIELSPYISIYTGLWKDFRILLSLSKVIHKLDGIDFLSLNRKYREETDNQHHRYGFYHKKKTSPHIHRLYYNY